MAVPFSVVVCLVWFLLFLFLVFEECKSSLSSRGIRSLGT